MEISFPKMSKSIITVVVALIAIGFAEHYDLCTLFWISVVFGVSACAAHLIMLVKYVKYYKPNH